MALFGSAWYSSLVSFLTSLVRRRVFLAVGLLVVLVLLKVSLFTGVSRFPFVMNGGYSLPSSPFLRQGSGRTSRLHYLVPSGIVNDAVCAGAVSALLNRYPIPVIIGYKGEGEFDMNVHLAKIRVIDRYLANLNAEDDDLVIIVDSFDIVAQLPVELMIERYFSMRFQSETHLADQRGITVEQLHELGIRQTILYGAGKMCFTGVPNSPLCPLMPASTMPRYKFGFNNHTQDTRFLDPRYLNSGSVIGPVGDLRKLMPAILKYIEADSQKIYEDRHYRQLHNMDQWHTATVYVRQEYYRVLDMNGGDYPRDLSNLSSLPEPKQGPEDTTEYHIFVDFESEFTQTHCRNALEMHQVQFKNHDLTATISEDVFNEGDTFQPYDIQMPSNLYRAFGRVWDKLSSITDFEVHESKREWIQNLNLGVNVASEKVHAFYHNTCNKKLFLGRYHGYWFEPYIVPLLRDARQGLQQTQPVHSELIDGRMWVAAEPYPVAKLDPSSDEGDLGGVFTDFEDEPYIDLRVLCGANLTQILGLRAEA